MPRTHLTSRPRTATHIDSDVADDWRHKGNCTQYDPDVMFPFPSDILAEVHALGVCHGCPVTEPCGQWAMQNGERDGVWGGMTERERRHRAAGRLTTCPGCRRGHYQRHWNQTYCLACRRPTAIQRAERMEKA